MSTGSPGGLDRSEARRAADRLIAVVGRARELQVERAPSGTDVAIREPRIDLCGSLLAMRLAPALDGGAEDPEAGSEPFHVAVFGGTNTGKSTVLNALLGRPACGMKVTARFSQAPEGWCPAEIGDRWRTAHPSRFRGYRVHVGERAPRQTDAELRAGGWRSALAVLDPATDGGPELAPPATRAACLWDAPDVSTEEAQSWLDGVLDVAALSDVLVFVCTHESYADDRALQLLALLRSAGTAVLVCVNKIAADASLHDDVRRKLGDAGGLELAPESFAWLPQVEGDDPTERLERLLATPEARALRERVGGLEAEWRSSDPERGPDRDPDRESARDSARESARARALDAAAGFLESSLDDVLEPLRAEARVAERWAAVVERATRTELVEAYSRRYLESQRYEEFRRALAELTRLLELPGLGPLLSGLGRVARAPLSLAKLAWSRWIKSEGDDASKPAEERVLAELFKAWLEALRAEAQTLARAEGHPAWSRLAARLDSAELQAELVAGFQAGYRDYRARLDERVAQAAARIHEKVAENPRLLAGLRTANLVGDAGVTISAVAAGGLSPTDLVLGPLVHGLWNELVERGLGSYIRAQETRLKAEQLEDLRALLARELAVPVRALFVGAFDPEELERARADLTLVIDALRAREDRR